MSLLQDIKESFESRSYLDTESAEGQDFISDNNDDIANQDDVERSEYSDRKAEEEYAKEQEAVRSTIELLEDNLEDIKALSPAYTESAKEVVNAQLADVSQALSLENGFGQLELDDTGHVSMESYLEVRKALAKARKVYSVLSMEGIMDWFRGKGKTKNPMETLKKNIETGKERTESIKGSDIYYIASKDLNVEKLITDVDNRIKLMSDLLTMYIQIAPVSLSNIKETVASLKTGKDRSDELNASKLKAFNSKVTSRLKSSGKSLLGVEFDVPNTEYRDLSPMSFHYSFNFNSGVMEANKNTSIKPMTLEQVKDMTSHIDNIRHHQDKFYAKMEVLSKVFPFDNTDDNFKSKISSKYSISPSDYSKIDLLLNEHAGWCADVKRAFEEANMHVDIVIKDLITYATLSTQ